MRIEVDGQHFDVPDDATPDEIDHITQPAQQQPSRLRKALGWATTPFENVKPLLEENQKTAASQPPGLLRKDSGNLLAGTAALLSGAVPGASDNPMGAEGEGRMRQFREEHPALSILLPMAGGLGRPGMLPTQRVPQGIDPVIEQIRRVSGATPAASRGLPEIPKALDFLLPSHVKLGYKLLRAVAKRGEGAVASNPYPAEAGAAQAAGSMGPVPPPAAAQELSPVLQAAQAESRARLDKWAQAAAQPPPAAPAAEQAAPQVARIAEQAPGAAPTAANIFEQAGRAKKVQELVKAIDANAGAHLGVDPRDPRFAEALADLPEQWWDGMANVAKINKPSTQTISEATAFFRDRAAQATRAAK